MRLMKLFVAVSLVSFAGLFGCGTSCEDLCDQGYDHDCNGGFNHGGCYKACTDAEDLNADTDKCKDEYDKFQSCMKDLDDICDAYELNDQGEYKKCKSTREDWESCQIDYCKEHHTRDYCVSYVDPANP